jgi:putative glutamine amidotransferase
VSTTRHRPLRIGLSACFFHADPTRPIFKGKTLLYLEESIARWVGSQGAVTYLLPRLDPGSPALGELVDDIDGLVLQGGSDVCPRTYGEEPLDPAWEGDEARDRYEIDLLRRVHELGKPVLGVCRGAQVLNVAFGGTLFQDIATQVDTTLTPGRAHRDWERYDANRHPIAIEPGSGLAHLYPGVAEGMVNSVHHQAAKDVGDGLVVEARATDDGVVEALRLDPAAGLGDGYVVGVQWHPEWTGDDPDLLDPAPVLAEFLAAAEAARAQRGA